MPFPGAVFTSSAGGDIGGGRTVNQHNGPVLSGIQVQAVGTGTAGPLPAVGGFFPVQSTGGATNLISSASNRIAFTYIPASTLANGWVGSTGTPPYAAAAGGTTALLWDDVQKQLFVWSPASGSWMQPHQLGSSGLGAVITWSASSS